MSHCFFQNTACPFFPCHDILKEQKDAFNCMFCFCPLYPFPDCGGDYTILKNNIKDCSTCVRPHFEYDYIIAILRDMYGFEW